MQVSYPADDCRACPESDARALQCRCKLRNLYRGPKLMVERSREDYDQIASTKTITIHKIGQIRDMTTKSRLFLFDAGTMIGYANILLLVPGCFVACSGCIDRLESSFVAFGVVCFRGESFQYKN